MDKPPSKRALLKRRKELRAQIAGANDDQKFWLESELQMLKSSLKALDAARSEEKQRKLQEPIIKFNERDVLTLKDAESGILIAGSSGAGKSKSNAKKKGKQQS